MERLQKVIANSGYTSRRKAEELISSGHVEVNGELITELGYKVSGTDIISIDGNTINKDKLNKNCDNLTNTSINYYFFHFVLHKCTILSLLFGKQ